MWPLKSALRTEDPERLKRFISQLEKSDWNNFSSAALQDVYIAVNDLIYQEVLYYYKARKRGRQLSTITRGFAVLFGTVGIMIPLLVAADGTLFKPVSPYGYIRKMVPAAKLLRKGSLT